MPHGITTDKDNNYWVTDVALHQVSLQLESGYTLFTVYNVWLTGTYQIISFAILLALK